MWKKNYTGIINKVGSSQYLNWGNIQMTPNCNKSGNFNNMLKTMYKCESDLNDVKYI